ncbi:MAG TPA: LCP family protein, partial [Solirubrobacteraceae bacterium]
MLKRFLIGGVAIALLSGAATATVALNKVTTIANEVFPGVNRIHAPAGVIAEAYGGAPQTFLLIGSDKRAKSKSAFDRANPPHSDTMLLVRLDPNQGQTSVLSIPRDLLAKIATPSGQVYYPEKINGAYTIGSSLKGTDGGARLAAETIEHLLGIKLNGVIDATFKGFIEVVDSLGCVYINVDHRYYHVNGLGGENYSEINLQPGYQKLCYNNALSYVRYRHGDSDFVRVARQQDFIRDLREQVPVGNLVGEIDTVSKAVGRAVTTTFHSSAGQLIELGELAAFSQQKPLRQVKFQVDNANATISGGSYVTSSPTLIKATVREFLHGHEQLKLPSSNSSHSHHSSQGTS